MKGYETMAEYKEITHKNKDGKEKTIKYRIDAGFVPKKLDEICEEFIQNYCLEKGEEDWLDEQYASTETFKVKADKRTYKNVEYKKGDTYEGEKSFISIRKDFAEKFFGIKKKAEEKAKTGREKWAEKKKKANA